MLRVHHQLLLVLTRLPSVPFLAQDIRIDVIVQLIRNVRSAIHMVILSITTNAHLLQLLFVKPNLLTATTLLSSALLNSIPTTLMAHDVPVLPIRVVICVLHNLLTLILYLLSTVCRKQLRLLSFVLPWYPTAKILKLYVLPS
jgi:hypothetical protein